MPNLEVRFKENNISLMLQTLCQVSTKIMEEQQVSILIWVELKITLHLIWLITTEDLAVKTIDRTMKEEKFHQTEIQTEDAYMDQQDKITKAPEVALVIWEMEVVIYIHKMRLSI